MRPSTITPDGVEYIKANWSKITVESIAAYLGVSTKFVSRLAHKMGCPKLAGNHTGKPFYPTQDHLDFIRDNWSSLPLKTIGRKLGNGVSPNVVRRLGSVMGLPELRGEHRKAMATRYKTKDHNTQPPPLPVIESSFIKSPTRARLMAGR